MRKARNELGLCDEKGMPVSEVRAGVMAIDVEAGQHAAVLRMLTQGTEDRRIWLARGLYDLSGCKYLKLRG